MTPFVRPRAVRRGDRLLAHGVFLLLLAVYTATFTGLPDNPDAEVEFQTTSALVREQTLALGGTPEAEGILAYAGGSGSGFNVHEGSGERQGEYFSWFGVGQAFVGVPFYLLGSALAELFPGIQAAHTQTTHYGVPRSEYFQHLLVGWRNPLLAAWTAWLVVLVTRRVGGSRPAALLAGLSYGFCTFVWPQARSTLSDVQATFFLFYSLHLVLRFREGFDRTIAPARLELAAFGLTLGGAFLTRVVTAPVIAILAVMLVVVLLRGRRRIGRRKELGPDLLFAFVPALLLLGVFLFTNHQRFGDVLETGYGDAVFSGTFFSHPPLLGLAGLFVAAGKGLVFLAPGIVLAPLGAVRAIRRRDTFLPVCSLLIAVAVLAPIVPAETWHGAWTYGPRYVLALLPVLWVLVGLGLDALAEVPWGKTVAAVPLVFGLLTNLPGALVDHMTHQDLALQSMRLEWPEAPGVSEAERDNKRFEEIQWSWRYAAPWAHWRILRHRIAGLGEEFPVRRIFFVDSDALVSPSHARDRGFQHLAWIDLRDRLGGQTGPVLLFLGAMFLAGIVLVVRGFDPTSG